MDLGRSTTTRRALACAAAVAAALLARTAAREADLRTMRVDYVHSGQAGAEHFALDGVALEGLWPGPPDKRLDDTNLGKYFFEVIDRTTNRTLYSRGFASVYGEWETTDEAKSVSRAFQESLRFPEPAGPVQIVLKTRRADGSFREAWSVSIDPASPFVNRAAPPSAARVWPVIEHGPPADKVDVLLVGDGYTVAERPKWHADARRLAETLLSISPFRERRQQFNVWAVDIPSDESGVSRPGEGVHRRSAVRATYDAFGSERYVLVFDNARLREVAAAVPYEFLEVVVNDRKYGGGGIFNQYATVAADHAFTPFVLVHEFGHHFAGLADEYCTSDVAYESPKGRPEPWEKNVTADPQASKWRELLTPGVVLPTPWPKEAFEALQEQTQARRREVRAKRLPEQEMERLFRDELAATTRLLGAHAGQVGAFEGAMYEAKGYYRPQADCLMFTRDEVGFCAVCRRAIEQVIALYSR